MNNNITGLINNARIFINENHENISGLFNNIKKDEKFYDTIDTIKNFKENFTKYFKNKLNIKENKSDIIEKSVEDKNERLTHKNI